MKPVIETKGLTKTFRLGLVEVEVLKGISLEIGQGEFVSVMGPSGSGKSTLLYLLGGLDAPTAGSIRINGKELAAMKDEEQSVLRRRDLGFVFQFYNLIPNLNVEENILVPVLLDGKRVRDYKHKVGELLDLVGLTDRRHHTPRELSGGQQQRVAIARALINDPGIILADEPTGNLDSESSTAVLELLKHISGEQGRTVVQVTHSQEAAAFGNRVIQLLDGRVAG